MIKNGLNVKLIIWTELKQIQIVELIKILWIDINSIQLNEWIQIGYKLMINKKCILKIEWKEERNDERMNKWMNERMNK